MQIFGTTIFNGLARLGGAKTTETSHSSSPSSSSFNTMRLVWSVWGQVLAFLLMVTVMVTVMVTIVWWSPSSFAQDQTSTPVAPTPALNLSQERSPAENSPPEKSPAEKSPSGASYTPTDILAIKKKVAPVTLDGQELFEVATFEEISAEARANNVSELLDALASERRVPDITIAEGRGTTTIVIEGAVDLITVTKADAIQNFRSPKAQAEEWVAIIEKALEKAQAERNPEVLRQSIVLALIAVILTYIAFWYVGRWQQRVSRQPLNQLKRLLRGKVKRDGIPIHVRQVALAIGLRLIRYGLWVGVIFFMSQIFPSTRQVARQVMASFTTGLFPLGDKTYSLLDLMILVGGFLGLVVGSTLITNLLRTRILQLAGIGSGAQQAIATLARYTLIALGTVVILQLWGLDLSSLTIIASALGVGIGFGLQNIARDFGSGLILLFERPVQVGDFIEVGHFRGTVERIGARSTMIQTLDKVSVIVPNSYFLENQVVNWSHNNPLSRISIPVGVSYESEPEVVRSLLLQAGTTHKKVLPIPAPQVLFKGFGDNALNFELLVWIVEPDRQPLIKSDLNFSVLALLRQHGIEIPYPQRDLHIRTGHVPAIGSAASTLERDRSQAS